MKNNNHTLPWILSAPVALFGRVQKNYFYVGNGSGGDVSAPYSINLVQGLVNASGRTGTAPYWPPMKAGAPPLSTTRYRGGTGPAIMQKCR